MARCKRTSRDAVEGEQCPRKTIRLPERSAEDDLSAEAKQEEEEAMRNGPFTNYTSESDGTENSSVAAVESVEIDGGSGSDKSPQYTDPTIYSSPTNSTATLASATDDWSVNSTDHKDSSSPSGHAQNVKTTELGGIPPSEGPYYINLSGSGYVEIRVPGDRLVWGDESGEETGQRNIEVTGKNKNVQCKVTQRVYGADGEHSESVWWRTMAGMYIWWWACTITYRCVGCARTYWACPGWACPLFFLGMPTICFGVLICLPTPNPLTCVCSDNSFSRNQQEEEEFRCLV